MNQQSINYSGLKNQLIDISKEYKALRATNNVAKSQDYVKLITKLSDLNVQLTNEVDNNLITEVIGYISEVLPKNDSKLLHQFTNLVTYLTEKTVSNTFGKIFNHFSLKKKKKPISDYKTQHARFKLFFCILFRSLSLHTVVK